MNRGLDRRGAIPCGSYFFNLPITAHSKKTRKNGVTIYISPSDCGTNGPDAVQAVIITIMPTRKRILVFISEIKSIYSTRHQEGKVDFSIRDSG